MSKINNYIPLSEKIETHQNISNTIPPINIIPPINPLNYNFYPNYGLRTMIPPSSDKLDINNNISMWSISATQDDTPL
jgi:hypothetical protein